MGDDGSMMDTDATTLSLEKRPRHSARLVLAVLLTSLVTALVVFVACLAVWHNLGGGAWRSSVGILEAYPPEDRTDRLTLLIQSCHGAPRVKHQQETNSAVRIRVQAFSTPLRGAMDCLDALEVQLEAPLGDRILLDLHTGREVPVLVPSDLSHRRVPLA